MPGNPDAYVNRTYDQTVGALRRRKKPAASGDQPDRWPRVLNLKTLARPCRAANPMDEDFDYAKEFLSLDLDQLARDVDQLGRNDYLIMTNQRHDDRNVATVYKPVTRRSTRRRRTKTPVRFMASARVAVPTLVRGTSLRMTYLLGSIRVHQSGGLPIHAASTRHPSHPRPPPPQRWWQPSHRRQGRSSSGSRPAGAAP
jgi:hypothetical protein